MFISVDVFRINAEGKKFIIEDQGRPNAARERLHGVVIIDFPKGLD